MSKYDYTQSMMMKIFLSEPIGEEDSKVYADFAKALDIIKDVDNITKGIKKIVYLVGWQYNGHDDKYPAFFEVNPRLKREEDSSALESLNWLILEARKYNTVVSLHINIADAYPSSPLWNEYIKNDLILCTKSGKPKVTGVWNGKKAYQIRLHKELESGYFKKRVDRLLDMLPVIYEQGTIHIDAFFVRKGKDTSVQEEKKARKEMIAYFKDKGIDVTTEFIYREKNSGMKSHYGKSDTIGIFDAYWNPIFTSRDVMRYSVEEVAGGRICNSLMLDKSLHYLVYGNMQGENLFKESDDWHDKFIKEFITYTLPYYFLNRNGKSHIKGIGVFRRLYYDNDIVASVRGRKITEQGRVLKENNDLCLPALWLDGAYYGYSETGGVKNWYVNASKVKVYSYKNNCWQFLGEYDVSGNMLSINTEKETAYFIASK